jgi:hypothetical protein
MNLGGGIYQLEVHSQANGNGAMTTLPLDASFRSTSTLSEQSTTAARHFSQETQLSALSVIGDNGNNHFDTKPTTTVDKVSSPPTIVRPAVHLNPGGLTVADGQNNILPKGNHARPLSPLFNPGAAEWSNNLSANMIDGYGVTNRFYIGSQENLACRCPHYHNFVTNQLIPNTQIFNHQSLTNLPSNSNNIPSIQAISTNNEGTNRNTSDVVAVRKLLG